MARAGEAEHELFLGIDVGATKTHVALGRADGTVLGESYLERWTSGDVGRDLDTLVERARGVLDAAGVSVRALAAIGVSAPGPLDPASGVVRDAPNLPGWHEVPICEHFERAFGRPVRLENDANAAALAEWRFGAGRGSRAFAFLTMSTGVGAGLVLDGRLYRGARFGAGELGHGPLVAGGRLCACGIRGCLEAYTGGAALAARMREDVAEGVETKIAELAGGDPAKIDARLWIAALRAGDAYARRLREEYLERLAQALALLVIGLDVDRVALGTIVARNPDLFLDDLRARFAAQVWPRLRDTRIEAGELGERLPVYAGLCTALLEPFEVSDSLP
jgi:glucokinase